MTGAAETYALAGELVVGRIGFGSRRLTGRGSWGDPARPDEARAVLREAVGTGVNFIDTADSYGPEVAERLIGEALRPYPHELVIATKGGYRRDGPWRWRPDGRPLRLREACEASLRRLGLERIDLYYLHTPDPAVPFEESVGALAELRAAGKIRHVGLSNVDADAVRRAQALVPVAAVQNRYNVLERDGEDVLRLCEREGVAFVPWFPLAKGRLAGRRGALASVAAAHRATPAQIALAWLLHDSPANIPIPGTGSREHLRENVAAARIALTSAEVAALRTLEPPRVRVPPFARRTARTVLARIPRAARGMG